MKKFFLGLAVLLAVLIVTVVVMPSFIDWTKYRNGIAAELEQALGRRVVIEGSVDASMLPSPRLSLRGARLGNLDGASSPTMAQVDAMEVHLAFWPLLSGHIVATSVILHKPVIALERLADGRGNWQFTGPERGNELIRWNRTIVESIKFENAVIEDGTITYRDAQSGVSERVEGVNARFAIDGLYGPLRLAGELHYDSIPLRMTLSTGRLDPAGQTATPFNVTAEVRAATQASRRTSLVRGTGVLNGSIRLTESGLLLGGRMKVSGDDLADFIAALGPGAGLPNFLAQPFNMEGLIVLKDDSLTANGMSLQFGETHADGAVSAAFGGDTPRLDIALTLGRINLDSWRAAAVKKAAIPRGAQDNPASGSADFILPSNMHMTLDVGIDAVTYGGMAARQAHLAAEMSDGVVEIHQFEAQFPGATAVGFNGRLLASEGRARLDGHAELSSDDFRTVLGLFDVDMTDMPAGRLNKIAAMSDLSLTREFLNVGGIDLRFDNTRLTGAVDMALRDRPAFGVNLIVDHLNLDTYFPPDMAAPPKPASPLGLPAFPLSILTEFDANLRLQLGQLDKGDATLRDARLEGALVDGVLTISELAIADLAGGSMTLAGTVDGFRDRLRLNLEFDIDAADPADTLRRFTMALPLPDTALKPFSAHGKIFGDDKAHKIDGTVTAAELVLTMNGDLSLPRDGAAQFAVNIGIEHPDYVDFLRIFDPAFTPERDTPTRAVSLQGRILNLNQDYSLSGLRGQLGPLTFDGNASVAFDGALFRIAAQLSAGDIDTRYFFAPSRKPSAVADTERWSSTPIALEVLRLFEGRITISGKSLRHGRWTIVEPKAEVLVADGGLNLKQFAGFMMGGALSLEGRIGPRGDTDPVMGLDFNLGLTGADLAQALFDSPGIDLSGGRLDFAMAGAGVGTSEAALIADMNARGSITVDNTQLKGFDLTRLNARFTLMENPGELVRLIQSTLSSGSTRVTKLDGDFTMAKGVVAFDDLRIKSTGADVRALIAADLLEWQLAATAEIQLSAPARVPKIELQMSGPLHEPRREFESYALQSFLMDERARQAASRPLLQNPPAPAPPPRPVLQNPPASP